MRFSLKRKYKISLSALTALFFTMAFLFTLYFSENQVRTALFEIAEMKAKNLALQAIHDVVKAEMSEGQNQKDLLQVKLDTQGHVSFVQPNTTEVNKLSANVALKIQDALNRLSADRVDIPLGQLTGTPLLAGAGPQIGMKIVPMGAVNVELENRFVDAGINQTKHSIGLSVTAVIKIVVPLMSETVDVKASVPITEYVIVGGTPDTYVRFPAHP